MLSLVTVLAVLSDLVRSNKFVKEWSMLFKCFDFKLFHMKQHLENIYGYIKN